MSCRNIGRGTCNSGTSLVQINVAILVNYVIGIEGLDCGRKIDKRLILVILYGFILLIASLALQHQTDSLLQKNNANFVETVETSVSVLVGTAFFSLRLPLRNNRQ